MLCNCGLLVEAISIWKLGAPKDFRIFTAKQWEEEPVATRYHFPLTWKKQKRSFYLFIVCYKYYTKYFRKFRQMHKLYQHVIKKWKGLTSCCWSTCCSKTSQASEADWQTEKRLRRTMVTHVIFMFSTWFDTSSCLCWVSWPIIFCLVMSAPFFVQSEC